MIKKLKNTAGTTLTETLATVVLLGLMGVALVAGIGAVQKAYGKIVRKANEQVLLSTALTEMRDILRYTSASETGSAESDYFKSEDGYWIQFSKSEENKAIKIKYFWRSLDGSSWETAHPDRSLVFKKKEDSSNVNMDIHAEFDSVKYSGGKITIKGLKVVNDNDESDAVVLSKDYIISVNY